MSSPKANPDGERLLSLEEWLAEIPPLLGLSPAVAIRRTKLGAVAEALTLPAAQIGERVLFDGMAAKTSALISRLLRARVVHFCNREAALATGSLYLQRNGYVLAVPPDQQGELNRLADAVAKDFATEPQLTAFLDRCIVRSGEELTAQGPDPLLVYVAISTDLGERQQRQRLYDSVEAAAVGAASSLANPVDLATTCPGLVAREPAENWQARRGLLVRGDRDVLGPERAHCAAGMIVVGGRAGDVAIGLELAMLGPRGPVLWLAPADGEVPNLVHGYAETHGNVRVERYQLLSELRRHVSDFIAANATQMLCLARQRRDAALVATSLQFRLRHRLMCFSPVELMLLLARTGFSLAYLMDLLAEPTEYSRADFCDLRLLVNEAGEPFEDHVAQATPRALTERQETAWLLAVGKRGLAPPRALELRNRGQLLVADPQARASLSECEDWEALLDLEPVDA